jgi:hypothetical protein
MMSEALTPATLRECEGRALLSERTLTGLATAGNSAMITIMLISPIAPCPCGRTARFRDCCDGKVDWPRLLASGHSPDVIKHLSARGKNVLFANEMGRILQLDAQPQNAKWSDIKRAVTPEVVRALHEAVAAIWPDRDDLNRVLYEQRAEQTGLFVGTYQPEPLVRAIARHALYSDVMLAFDPFRHPLSLRDQFNPILNPKEHRVNTLIGLRLWWLLLPWIDAGIVRIIHTPADFDPYLALSALETAKERKDKTPELQSVLAAEIDERMDTMDEVREFVDLSIPNEEVERRVREQYPDITDEELDAMLSELEHRRKQHPFFIEPVDMNGKQGDFLMFGAGAPYDIAKLVASETAGYLITDQRYRWKEIELDRKSSGIDDQRWSAFAKALQSANLRFLDAADIKLAVRLRQENRLEDLRLFFRRVWKKVSSAESFDEAASVDLAAELDDRVREAEDGWRGINHDL